MSTDDIISTTQNKSFLRTSKNLSEADQIVIETQWTDKLQRSIDLGNSKFLKNFKLRLEMDDDNDSQRLRGETEYNVR